jgi:membrane associated rhomboid family serine protease
VRRRRGGLRSPDAATRERDAVIPIRDANPTRRFPIVTVVIITANVLVFLLWQPTFGTQEQQTKFYLCHAEIPYEVSHQTSLAEGGAGARAAISETFGAGSGAPVQRFLRTRCPAKSWWLSVFVAMFLHGGWLHIGGNMLFLWVFGNNVEDRLGYLVYPIFYLLGGIAATVLQTAIDPSSAIPNLGASGAIAAVLGAYIVIYPRARITTLLFFFFITVIEIPAYVVLGGWFVLQLFTGTSELGGGAGAGGVAYWAHVGGFVFGAIVAFLFYRGRGDRKFEPYGIPRRPDLF